MMTQFIQDGMYTIVYPNNEHRTLKFKTHSRGNLVGSTVISYRDGSEWTAFGFLSAGKVAFWKRFRALNSDVRLKRIEKAVSIVLGDPEKAGLAYALMSRRCWRCDIELTDPESIRAGLGPDCRKKVHRMAA